MIQTLSDFNTSIAVICLTKLKPLIQADQIPLWMLQKLLPMFIDM